MRNACRTRKTSGMPAEKEPTMIDTIDIIPPFRELAHRDADGIDVTLLWDPDSDRAFVAVIDSRNGVAFDVEVGNTNAMQVFHHPYVYCELDVAA